MDVAEDGHGIGAGDVEVAEDGHAGGAGDASVSRSLLFLTRSISSLF